MGNISDKVSSLTDWLVLTSLLFVSCCLFLLLIVGYVIGLWPFIPYGSSSGLYFDTFDGVVTLCKYHDTRGVDSLQFGTHYTGKQALFSFPNSPHEPKNRHKYVDVQYGHRGLPWFHVMDGEWKSNDGSRGADLSLTVSPFILMLVTLFYPALSLGYRWSRRGTNESSNRERNCHWQWYGFGALALLPMTHAVALVVADDNALVVGENWAIIFLSLLVVAGGLGAWIGFLGTNRGWKPLRVLSFSCLVLHLLSAGIGTAVAVFAL